MQGTETLRVRATTCFNPAYTFENTSTSAKSPPCRLHSALHKQRGKQSFTSYKKSIVLIDFCGLDAMSHCRFLHSSVRRHTKQLEFSTTLIRYGTFEGGTRMTDSGGIVAIKPDPLPLSVVTLALQPSGYASSESLHKLREDRLDGLYILFV